MGDYIFWLAVYPFLKKLFFKQGNSPFPCHFLFQAPLILYVIMLTITYMVRAPEKFLLPFAGHIHGRGIFVFQLRSFHLFFLLIFLLQRFSEIFQNKYLTTFYFQDLSVLSCVNNADTLLRLQLVDLFAVDTGLPSKS